MHNDEVQKAGMPRYTAVHKHQNWYLLLAKLGHRDVVLCCQITWSCSYIHDEVSKVLGLQKLINRGRPRKPETVSIFTKIGHNDLFWRDIRTVKGHIMIKF